MLPSLGDQVAITKLVKESQRATVKLLARELTLLRARSTFDALITKFPDISNYLATDASIINNPAFEQNYAIDFQKPVSSLLSDSSIPGWRNKTDTRRPYEHDTAILNGTCCLWDFVIRQPHAQQ